MLCVTKHIVAPTKSLPRLLCSTYMWTFPPIQHTHLCDNSTCGWRVSALPPARQPVPVWQRCRCQDGCGRRVRHNVLDHRAQRRVQVDAHVWLIKVEDQSRRVEERVGVGCGRSLHMRRRSKCGAAAAWGTKHGPIGGKRWKRGLLSAVAAACKWKMSP